MGGRVFRNYYKGHMHKTKREVREGGGLAGVGGAVGENADNCN